MAFVPVYIFILGFTIVIDYIAGIYIEKAVDLKLRKFILLSSLLANIGVLFFFKYYNFFNSTLDKIFGYGSYHSPLPYLHILLPIGLSFHTFQAMSYTIEVFRGKYKAEKHFGIYALYVMFYPQLVAGPIERPQNVLWQFHLNHKYDFENLKSGLMQMAFGLFKKVVIADRISQIVDPVYANPDAQNGNTFLVTMILYSFQIYCDFSGYSDIGIGAARTMGYKLVDNFNVPYLSRSIGEFWSKWHMSLSTWFRDYLYIPLGGSRVKVSRKYFNIMVVFLISGLWHGARWTFVVWGALHGIFLIIENIKKDFFVKAHSDQRVNPFLRVIQTLAVFLLVSLAWVFFRSPNIATAKTACQKIFSASLFCLPDFSNTNNSVLLFTFILIAGLLIKEYFYLTIRTTNTVKFYFIFTIIILSCYLFGIFDNEQFIYFQF